MGQTKKEFHTSASLRSIADKLKKRAKAIEQTADFLDARKIGRIQVLGSVGVRRKKTGALDALELFSDKAWKAATATASLRPPTGG